MPKGRQKRLVVIEEKKVGLDASLGLVNHKLNQFILECQKYDKKL